MSARVTRSQKALTNKDTKNSTPAPSNSPESKPTQDNNLEVTKGETQPPPSLSAPPEFCDILAAIDLVSISHGGGKSDITTALDMLRNAVKGLEGCLNPQNDKDIAIVWRLMSFLDLMVKICQVAPRGPEDDLLRTLECFKLLLANMLAHKSD